MKKFISKAKMLKFIWANTPNSGIGRSMDTKLPKKDIAKMYKYLKNEK